jgi:hypothetical protein
MIIVKVPAVGNSQSNNIVKIVTVRVIVVVNISAVGYKESYDSC